MCLIRFKALTRPESNNKHMVKQRERERRKKQVYITSISSVLKLNVVSETAISSTSLRPPRDVLVVGASIMPSQTNKNWVAKLGVEELFDVFSSTLQLFRIRSSCAVGGCSRAETPIHQRSLTSLLKSGLEETQIGYRKREMKNCEGT